MDWSGYVFEVRHALWGETPPVYVVELVGRTVTLLTFALILVRWLGKRGIGQISPYEFVVLIAMGSALGDPMFYPNVPLLPPMIVLAVIVAVQRLLSWLTQRSERIEQFIEGKSRVCIREGRVELAALGDEHVPLDELAMMLRDKGIENLADVKTAILETSGHLSVFPFDDDVPRIGLSLTDLLPERADQRLRAGDATAGEDLFACLACGHCRKYSFAMRIQPCSVCAGEYFVTAKRC